MEDDAKTKAQLISELEQLRQRIAESEESIKKYMQTWEELDRMFNLSLDMLSIADKKGYLQRVNPAWEKTLGYTEEELLEKSFSDFIHPEDRTASIAEVKKIYNGAPYVHFENRYRCKDGSYKWLVWTVLPLVGEGVINFVGRDITARKQIEKEREHLVKELEAKNSELERFTYTISHDLRSPLVTMQGFTNMLLKDLERNDREKAELDLKYIVSAVDNMSSLLSDTLKLSRSGRVVNPPEDVPFGDIVEDALEQAAEQIKSSGVEIAIANDLPAVHVDRMRIAEVLVNLIVNSINYRGTEPNPRIEIGHRLKGKETVFFVKDNGIGIEKSEHEKVFELFYKVDKNSKGTGAGLAIVKRIIEVHDGRIWIESEKGKGCTVCFTLPVA